MLHFHLKFAIYFLIKAEIIKNWYGNPTSHVNTVPQSRSTLQYVVSYVKLLEDFAQTKYCSSNEKKNKIFCRVWYAGSYLRNETIPFRVLVISYRWTVLSYFVPTNTRPTYICIRCSRAIWAFSGWVVYCGSYLQVWRQTDENRHDSGPQMFRHTIFDKRGAILW
jgi:hypothetical protein